MASKSKPAKVASVPRPRGQEIALGADAAFITWMDAGKDVIVVTESTFRDVTAIDIRRYYDNGERWMPSPKGLRVPTEHKDLVAAMLRSILQHVEAK